MNVWIFPVENQFIVKRNASFHKQTRLDLCTGFPYIELIQGFPAVLPTWEWTQKVGDEWFAGYQGRIYNISDIANAEASVS
jgi:hypothetical protein